MTNNQNEFIMAFNQKHKRCCQKPFPPYRFVPGLNPHPTEDPKGHSFGKKLGAPDSIDPLEWEGNELYLYGVDLYNHFYWWEAHEAWESLWGAAPAGSTTNKFFQGLIKISAAFLKWHMKERRGVQAHFEGGTILLRNVRKRHRIFMGIDLEIHINKLTEHFTPLLSQPSKWPDPILNYPFIELKK